MNNKNNYQMNYQQNLNNPVNEKKKFPGYRIGNEFNLELFEYAEVSVKNYSKLTTSQIRNIYNEVKNIQRKTKTQKIFENELMVRIKLLKAKVRYNAARNTNALDDRFKEDLETWIDNIKNMRDFEDFCILFESVVGFFYDFNAKKQHQR